MVGANNTMTRADLSLARAGIMDHRRRAAAHRKAGRTQRAEQITRWADVLALLLRERPRGCHGCAYERERAGRCVDCARVTNRTDNFTRKYV